LVLDLSIITTKESSVKVMSRIILQPGIAANLKIGAS
jgi:hypothetical protein